MSLGVGYNTQLIKEEYNGARLIDPNRPDVIRLCQHLLPV